MTNPTVREIVAAFLRANGYDGLYEDDCGCEIDDLFPCSEALCERCRAGYKVPCAYEGVWRIGPDKPGPVGQEPCEGADRD